MPDADGRWRLIVVEAETRQSPTEQPQPGTRPPKLVFRGFVTLPSVSRTYPPPRVNSTPNSHPFRQELYILEWYLTECLNEFKTAYQLAFARNLSLKKFSVVYHTDNFNARVYKLIEDVEALLALLGGIDPQRRPGKGEPSRRESMEKSLKDDSRHSMLNLIRGFRERDSIKRTVEARGQPLHPHLSSPDQRRERTSRRRRGGCRPGLQLATDDRGAFS